MRKLILTTAAVAAAIAGAFADETAFGTFTDTRDGQTYKTVKIGTQTWMAQNINYKPQTGNSWCYYCYEPYCKKYGRLYDWKTATTVCPKGWKLPSREDWDYLGQAVGGEKVLFGDGNIDWGGAGKKLKSKSGWNNRDDDKSGNGTDNYGFSALPGGYRDYDGYFGNAGNYGYWWAATEYGSDYAYYRYMNYNLDDVYEDNSNKSRGFSARCVADAP